MGVGPLPWPRRLRSAPVVASSRARSYANVVCDPLACVISSVRDCTTSPKTHSSYPACMLSRTLVVEIYSSPLSFATYPERGRVALCEPVGTRDCLERGRMTS
ncbi:hypothetical protein PanWU01x14_019170 [Parasponia andersonii]|uniref:Uncharacterized protein n=1 Tax=Parasponia andersonii TaxID=3476 RepID=A0A2P5DZE0_PARAD|nr:hypothetical protein PanWU01x14_019170 [Parasponia andersonii]